MTHNDATNFFVRYWQIIVVMFAMTGSWFSLKSDVSALQSAMADEKVETREQGDKQTEVEKAIVKIETTQSAMKDDIDDIKAAQGEQSDKLDKIIEKLSEQ